MKTFLIIAVTLIVQVTFAKTITLQIPTEFAPSLNVVANFDGSITASNLGLSVSGKYFPIQEDEKGFGTRALCKKLGFNKVITQSFYNGNSYFAGVITLDQNGDIATFKEWLTNYYSVINSVTCR